MARHVGYAAVGRARHESGYFPPMVEADLDAVVAIEQAAFSHPWARKLFQEGLSSYQCWVMCADDVQIGHGVIQLILDEAHLLNITVRAHRVRARVFGLQLLEHLMAEAGRQGGRECFLEVRASNQSAY